MVILIEVFDLIPNKEELLIKIHSLLKINGFFLFTYNNNKSWRRFLQKVIRFNYITDHFYLSNNEVSELLIRNKFKIQDRQGFHWIPFRVNSNNILISLFIRFERILQLSKWISQSPFIFIASQKLS